MKKIIALFTTLLALSWCLASLTAAETSHKSHEKMTMPAPDTMEKTSQENTFQHMATEKHIHAEFQVMSLASMNMKDPNGASHHIMVKLFHDSKKYQIKEAVGKIKIIGPDDSEQIDSLKNYNGIFAANFKFLKTGKYGVICLIEVNGEKHLFKFWYPYG